MTPTPLRLTNPYEDCIDPVVERPKISAKLSKADYNYLFRHVLAGEHGAAQCIVGTFYQKLISYLRDELRLPEIYDESNPAKLAEILTKHLQFNDPNRVEPPVEQPAPSPSVLRGTNGGRRANRGPSVMQGKSPAPKSL